MNSVSWFLYWAEVASSIKSAAMWVIVGTMIVGAVLAIFSPVLMIGADDFGLKVTGAQIWRGIKAATTGVVIATVIAIFVPSQNTIYAIAASQVGEQVIKNETVQGMASDATKALQQWIKRQIEPDKK